MKSSDTNRIKFPRAILHFDGDSFFASVEQVMNYELKGKVVITGGERGAITSVSIEGKRLGINRGVSLQQARILCPSLVVVSGDYTSYSIFARRMYSIVREFAFIVEEYSIDECFADITGLDERYGMSYEEIALMIKAKLELSLGVTFGVGLGPNKVIAKAASKHRKPAGFTSIGIGEIHEFLKDMPVGKLWGIGVATSHDMNRLGITTALDLALKPAGWFTDNKIAKPYREMWSELNGEYVKHLHAVPEEKVGSIIKSRTFRPPSSDSEFVFSQLSSNIESACIQIRRHSMKARHVRFYLKTQKFTYRSIDLSLSVPLSDPAELVKIAREHFSELFAPKRLRNLGVHNGSGTVNKPPTLFRATGVALSGIIPEEKTAHDLFGESERIEKYSPIFSVVDSLSHKYGKHTLFLGSSMKAFDAYKMKELRKKTAGKGKGAKRGFREELTFKGDRRKKTLDIPYLGKVR